MSVYSIQLNGNYHTCKRNATKVLLSSIGTLALCAIIITIL